MNPFRFRKQSPFKKTKTWKAKKKDVLQLWQQMPPNVPVQIKPISANHKGSRYDDDGIRLTGTSKFINSVMSRLKDMISYENDPRYRLDVEYRQIGKPNILNANVPKFVFYLHVVEKSPGKK